ncbi:TPA: hypothetical protein HA241_05805 [Candidatus Woesearchaeota archaeon]|nr:hypothetical protein [Candidatus Woesearchaeota archaeon]
MKLQDHIELLGLGHPLPLRLLHDTGIREALEAGRIHIDRELLPDQIQPATLDVRIGKVRVYDTEAMRLTALVENARLRVTLADLDREPTDEFATVYPDEKDLPIILPPYSYTEITPHETIIWNPEDYFVTTDLRSSRGRLILQLASDFFLPGQQHLAVWNWNPNPIILYGQSKFAQFFFHPNRDDLPNNGYVVTNDPEAKDLARTVFEDGVELLGPYLLFRLGDHLLRFKRDLGNIDTNKKYLDDQLYERKETTKPVHLGVQEPVIAQLHPYVKLPPDIGIKILGIAPFSQQSGFIRPNILMAGLEARCANAGWVDPGYEGYVTAHPFRFQNPVTLQRGDVLALGLFYKYSTSVGRAYGSPVLRSHYQGSTGTGTRS